MPLFVFDNVCVCLRACGRVCVCMQLRTSFTSFGQPLRCAHKRIVNIIKVYIEMNYMHGELILFCKKISALFKYTFAKRSISDRRDVYGTRSMSLCDR